MTRYMTIQQDHNYEKDVVICLCVYFRPEDRDYYSWGWGEKPIEEEDLPEYVRERYNILCAADDGHSRKVLIPGLGALVRSNRSPRPFVAYDILNQKVEQHEDV
jgi:hypothetical protein